MAQVTVMINGRNYRMACEDGQEAHLQGLASSLNDMISNLRGSFGEIGDQRLTVMAGVMALDEVSELKTKLSGLEEEIQSLREARSVSDSQLESSDGALADQILQLSGLVDKLTAKLSS